MGRRRTRGQHLANVRHFLAVVAALLLLNALLALGDFIETRWALLPAQLSVELVAFVVLIELIGARWRRAVLLRWFTAAILLALILMRVADIMVPWFFGRALNLVVDLRYVPFFVGMLQDALSPTMFVTTVAACAAALLMAFAFVFVLTSVAMNADRSGRIQALVVVAIAAMGAYAYVPARYDLGPPVATHVAAATWRNIGDVLDANGISGRYVQIIKAAEAARPHATLDFNKRNVLLVFAESYGTITYTDPAMAQDLNPLRAGIEEKMRAAGYGVYSGVLNSPITGGGSWMAHATLTSGVRVDSQPFYDVLLTSGLEPIGKLFKEAGYRTVAVAPRIEQPWPEAGEFFGFDAVLNSDALGYRGDRYSWETMPDQFVLERVHAREIAAAKEPLFLQYILSSSHLPFDHVPPMIADGRAIGDGDVYVGDPGKLYPPPAGQVFENRDGYRAAIHYVLESVGDYLSQRLDDNSLIIVLGDHQPPLTVAAATRNKAVPVHVFSKDSAALEPFRRAGYAAGMTPPAMTTETGMESFLPWLLTNFSATARHDG